MSGAAAGGAEPGAAELDAVRQIYRFWGRHARLYAAQDWVTFLGRHRGIRRRAAQATCARRGARVLEVACGSGRNFEHLEAMIGAEGRLVGLDASEPMLGAARQLAERSGWRNIDLVCGDAARLEVGEQPFDAVLSVLGMSAIGDHLQAFERCRQVLRPGGVLVVCDARPLSGRLRALNSGIVAVYRRWAAWNPERDLPADMGRIFGNVTVERFNLGTFFVASSTRAA